MIDPSRQRSHGLVKSNLALNTARRGRRFMNVHLAARSGIKRPNKSNVARIREPFAYS
jgi:hypothetical protein